MSKSKKEFRLEDGTPVTSTETVGFGEPSHERNTK